MLVVLKSDNGQTEEKSFDDMTEAAKWCLEYPEYGATLYPENNEEEWDYKEMQDMLDYYA